MHYIFVFEDDQSRNISDNGPQQELFTFVDLKSFDSYT